MPNQKQEDFKKYLKSIEFVYSSIEFVNDKEVVIIGCDSPDLQQQLDSISLYLNENNIIVSFAIENGVILDNKLKFKF